MWINKLNVKLKQINHVLHTCIYLTFGMISGADRLRESDNWQNKEYSIPFQAFTAIQNVGPSVDTGEEREWIGAAFFTPGFGFSLFRGTV